MSEPTASRTGLEIAVIGMAGRFPSAGSVDELWRNLLDEVDGISHLTSDELLATGVAAEVLADPRYVRAKGVFPGIESFDAAFFGYTPADAIMLDPQVRALHEEVYHALEDAGCSAERERTGVGLFLGCTNNVPWEADTLRRYLDEAGAIFSGLQLNDKDFAATRIAYALGLQGPAMTLHTACSTSLVAIDVACRNLWTGSCRIAVAGGSGLSLPHKEGYVHRENMINSPDGRCRAFDAAGSGTVEGNGAGVVVLKPLNAALRDGDTVHAVIKGSAVNNDGRRKVGYTAPSIEGQAEVIRKAHRVAGVRPAELSYVEAHGTGTAIGDPVETVALVQAFGPGEPDSCGIGSLKASVGHLDAAAGVASFIKACQVLRHRTTPRSLHFTELNPAIRFEGSPFFVTAERRELVRKRSAAGQEQPLRVAVSSFGIGGTNAHVVLEEAPAVPAHRAAGREHHTAVLAGASAPAIRRLKEHLVDHLTAHPDLDPADLAWTLQCRQRDLPHRYAVAYDGVDRLCRRLRESLDAGDEPVELPRNARRDVHLLFSGLGAQHLGMTRGLHETEEVFRDHLDEGLAICDELGNPAPREIYFGTTVVEEKLLNKIENTSLLLFLVEYALARTVLSWGLRPRGMIGHSTGELVAACVSGVFSLSDGIRLAHARGRLMELTPEGTLTSVKASEDVVRSMFTDDLSFAALNGPEDCTVSGPSAAVAALEQRCTERGVGFTHIESDHAYHSAAMEPMIERFREVVGAVTLHPPTIPYVSNVTGTWITAEQATDPEYYCAHVRETVRFRAGVETIVEHGDVLFVEVGPGKGLSSFVRGIVRGTGTSAVNLLRHRLEEISDGEHLATAVKKLWEAGVGLDWEAFHRGRHPRRIALPHYPFEPTEYPVDIGEFQRMFADDGDGAHRAAPERRPSPGVFPAAPSGPSSVDPAPTVAIAWSPSLRPEPVESGAARTLLVFTEVRGRLAGVLGAVPHWTPYHVTVGTDYRFRGAAGAQVRPERDADLRQLVADLREHALVGSTVVIERSDVAAAVALARRLAAVLAAVPEEEVRDLIVLDPGDAVPRPSLLHRLIGANLEHPGVRIRLVATDAARRGRRGAEEWSRCLRTELEAGPLDDVAVRYRAGQRYVPRTVPLHGRRAAPSGRAGRTVVVCPDADVDDVRAALAAVPWRTELLPVGGRAPEPTDGSGARLAVLPAVPAGAASVRAALLAAAGVGEIVVWDAPGRGDLVSLVRGPARELGVPCHRLSVWRESDGAWDADCTDWVAEDGSPEGVRLFSFAAPIDGSVLGLLRDLHDAGMPTAYRGVDLLEAQAAGKVATAGPDAGPADEQDTVKAAIEREIAALLGYPEVDGRADLFDIGLDSVKLVQFITALEKHGYSVLASDVHVHPTVDELARLISRSARHVNPDGATAAAATALIGERLGVGCRLHEVAAGAGGEPEMVLFVDGLDGAGDEDAATDLHRRAVRAVNDLRLPTHLVPHHIVPGSAAEAVLAAGTLAPLRADRAPVDPRELFAEIDRGQRELHASIASRPVRWSYPISGTQKHYFDRGPRPQIYLVQFRELLDVETLQAALRDVVGRHGLLRSFLVKELGRRRWREFEAPTEFALPRIDLSGLPRPQQEELRAELIKREWTVELKVDQLMYQAVLVKYDERTFDLLLHFDHSIFDGASGQAFRGDLLRRYQELSAGATRALPQALSYRYLQQQTAKGPVGITADEIIDRFDLDRWARSGAQIRKRSARYAGGRIRDVRYSVDLGRFPGVDPFSLVVHLYARLVARLLEVEEVALDLVFQSRVYEDVDYSAVMGMVADVMPVVISGRRGAQDDLDALIKDRIRLMNQHNVNFSSMVSGLRSLLRYGKVYTTTKEARGRGFKPSCMVNFAGSVEQEYDAIWDMTLQMLAENDEALDYADCYCVSKVGRDRLDVVILSTWIEDRERVLAILDDEVEHLAGRAPATVQ